MKRFHLLLITALALAVLFTATFSSTTLAASHRGNSCTPNWQRVQAAPIYETIHYVHLFLGTVSLARDGCGDIQATVFVPFRYVISATISITDVTHNVTVYSHSQVYNSYGVEIVSPIFSGYGGVGITASGSVTNAYGMGTGTTPPDYGN